MTIRQLASPTTSTAALPFELMLDRNGARRLRSLIAVEELARGQVLAREGEIGEDFLVVGEGVLKLWKELPEGRRQIIAFRSAGDLVTVHRCDTPWPATAEALVATKVYRIPWDALRRLANSYPKIDRALLDLVSDEITGLQEHLLALGRKTTEEKVAAFLLEFCRPSAVQSRNSREFRLPMRRPDIADYLGLTTETVCRELTRLKRERVVAMPRPSVVVLLNRPVLEALAAGETGGGANGSCRTGSGKVNGRYEVPDRSVSASTGTEIGQAALRTG